jgi:hypothetical protein
VLTLEETKSKLLEIYQEMESPAPIYDLLYELMTTYPCNRSIARMALMDLADSGKVELDLSGRNPPTKPG